MYGHRAQPNTTLYTEGLAKGRLDALVPFRRRRHELTVEGGSILWGTRVIIPRKLRPQILEELHKGHPGIVRRKALARTHVWWPNIDKDVEGCAKACQACHSNKNAPPKAHYAPGDGRHNHGTEFILISQDQWGEKCC